MGWLWSGYGPVMDRLWIGRFIGKQAGGLLNHKMKFSGSKQACEELMRLETKLSNGLN